MSHRHEFTVDASCECGVMISEMVARLEWHEEAKEVVDRRWAHMSQEITTLQTTLAAIVKRFGEPSAGQSLLDRLNWLDHQANQGLYTIMQERDALAVTLASWQEYATHKEECPWPGVCTCGFSNLQALAPADAIEYLDAFGEGG